MKIITIIGARPQFVKAAIVSHYIRLHNEQSLVQIEEHILHTGQHYDYNMSQIFFEEMGIPFYFSEKTEKASFLDYLTPALFGAMLLVFVIWYFFFK